LARKELVLNPSLHTLAENPVASIISRSWEVDRVLSVTMTPWFCSWEIVALLTPGVLSNTLVTRPEQPPQVMP